MLCVLIFVNLCRTAFLWDNPIFVFYYHQTPYTGISFLELNLWDVDQHHPRVAALIGQGMTFALSAGRGFLTHKGSDGSVHVYAALKVPEEWLKTCGVDWTDASSAVLRLVAALPFDRQETRWTHGQQAKYHELLTRATEIKVVNLGEYAC